VLAWILFGVVLLGVASSAMRGSSLPAEYGKR
jgi:ABC-type uncharacterized transport system permease subunit